jgi:hypothetical protein
MERCGSGVEPKNYIHIHGIARECKGMSSHTPKCTPTLGLEVLMNSQIFKEHFERSTFIGLKTLLYHWKFLIRRCLKWGCNIQYIYNTSYACPKWREFKFREFWDSQLGNVGKNDIWCNPMVNHKKNYKGEGGVFPHVWVMVNLVNPCRPMVCLCTQNVPPMH